MDIKPLRILPAIAPTISAFEQRYRTDHDNEHALLMDAMGRVVVERTGNEDSVQFMPQELERACVGTLTHNHPKAKSFSKDDLVLAAQYGLTIRAIGITPEGESLNYTVSMGMPNATLAKTLAQEFDNEIELAEQQLASRDWNDRKWDREVRHAAVNRLAQRHGFNYQRTQIFTAVAEMKKPYAVQRLDVLLDTETVIRREVFAPLLASVVSALTHASDARGVVQPHRMMSVRADVGRLVTYTMLGRPAQNGDLTPYTVHDDQVIPDSPYFSVLWKLMHRAAEAAIARHADMMRKYLPADLLNLLQSATVSPFQGKSAVHEITPTSTDNSEPSPLPQFDPLHLWVGPDGKRLSDRIWNAAGDMRRKLDDYLAVAISSGKPVSQMAAELEQFLIPGAGNYEAMRLARTEVAAAANRADAAAAAMNPLVEKYTPKTAPQHKCCDECDLEEANGPYPKSDMKHLPPFHPDCACGVVWHMVTDVKGVIGRLRDRVARSIADARKALTDFIGPISKRFLDLLFRGTP